MPPEPQKKFMWFLFLWNEHAMLSNTPLYCSACPTYESGNSRNERVKKKACATTAGSSFCIEAITFTKVSGLSLWARYWLVQQKDSALLISTSTAQNISYGFVNILSGIRMILLYSGHLEDKQAVENHLIYTGLLVCIDVCTLGYTMKHNFVVNISLICRSRFVCKIAKNCTHRKLAAIQ